MTAESSPLQLSLGVDAPHNNRSLFSDHYLAYLLPRDARWQAGLDEARDFLRWLQKLYAAEK